MKSTLGQNKVVGIVKNVTASCPIKQEQTIFVMTKRQQVLTGFDDRGAGWNSV